MIKRLFAVPMLALLLGACVTINIYFPAAAAEEAARTIVRDVLQTDEAEPAPLNPAGDKQSGRDLGLVFMVLAGRALDYLVPAAQAAQANIDINTAAIRAIRSSMQQRQAQLSAFYRSGAAGFDNRGDVAIRDLAAASLADRNRLKKLVADENADRARLYSEIARANGHPEWAGQVRDTFAKVWVQEALKGYWYQDGGGAWRQR
jgi:hypothetical protein